MQNGDKRLAVLVGCNYPNTRNKLHGCINDVVTMRDVLVSRFGFKPANIELLRDDAAPGSSLMPTGENIMAALDRMVNQAKRGDVLFFHYSGHGTLIPSNDELKHDLEAIVPCDFKLITDVDFRQLVNRLPEETSFTVFSDSCYSGGLIDKEEEQIGAYVVEFPTLLPNNRAEIISSNSIISTDHLTSIHVVDSPTLLPRYRAKSIPFDSIITGSIITDHMTSMPDIQSSNVGIDFSEVFRNKSTHKICWGQLKLDPSRPDQKDDSGILLSGCQANETSADVHPIVRGGKAYGAFSNAVQMVLQKNGNKTISNKELIIRTRKVLRKQGFSQHPCLYCSDENLDAPFLWQPVNEDII